MSFITSLGLLGLVASPAAAFWRLPCKDTLVVERADPIISPGKVSGHVHQIMGGNGFNFQMNYNDTQSSTCTSCTVHGDFSNYWTPVLYYQAQDGTLQKVNQIGGGLVYYLQRGGPNNDKLHAFPEGFQMVAGDPFKRSGGDDFASQGVSYNCLDYNGPAKPETGGFPNYNCPNGLRSQLFFPSCWDGKNLDSPDHKSHMSYPIGAYNSGSCPDTHPVHLISIFFEIIWDTPKFADKWYGNNQPFVWSMGDPTGYGFHGDFINGWNVDILQRAVDECTNDSGQVEDCPVFQLYPDATAEACKIPPGVTEDIQGPFAQLPGCNPIQAGPGEAQVPTNCVSNATITPGNGGSYPGSNGGSNSGSGSGNGGSGSGNGGTGSGSGNGGSGSPSGYNSPAPSPSSTGSSQAYSPPSSNGGSGSGSGSGNGGSSNNGGSSDGGSSGPPSPSPSSPAASPAPISCGGPPPPPPSNAGSAPPPSNASSAPPPSDANDAPPPSDSDGSSPPPPPGNGTVAPGDIKMPAGWTYHGCVTDTVRPRSLQKLAPYTLENTLMTSTNCVAYCDSKGFTLAGTEYAGECFCGNALTGSQKADDSECNMPCKGGDHSEVCGGKAVMNLYNKGTIVTGPASNATYKASSMKRNEHLVKHAMKARRFARGSAGTY